MRLLAGLLASKGASDLEDYEPPSEQLAEQLSAEGKPPSEQPPDYRRREVLQFIAETGGGLNACDR